MDLFGIYIKEGRHLDFGKGLAMGSSSLVPKAWHPTFNPQTKLFINLHMRVLMLGLPLELLSDRALEEIGNALVKFVYVDEGFLDSKDKRMERVLVKMDINKGLFLEINISLGSRSFVQPLDYWKIPFRCLIC